jgi:hypothetical protein
MNMTTPQTRQATASAPPCPSWCETNHHVSDPYTHYSATWEWANPAPDDGDDWRIGICLYRGDDPLYDEVGDTGIEIYVTGDGFMINADEEDRPELGGYLMPDQIRALATWLLAMADEADPHHTNGKPLEWHTPVRRPLLGRDR